MTDAQKLTNLTPHKLYKLLLNDNLRFWESTGVKAWQHYVQQAVINDNMLDYYYERLEEK